LDDWSGVRRATRNKSDTTWKNLLSVARLADPDEWRDQLRQAVTEKSDKKAWQALLSSVPVMDLPPATLLILSKYVRQNLGTKEAVALLRQAQAQHAGDFWINQELAFALEAMQQREQALRFVTAAMAARPQSPGAHFNVGLALERSGAQDEAIYHYQKAI